MPSPTDVQRWKDQDKRMIESRDEWPVPYLNMKTQPWVAVDRQRFGILVKFDDPTSPKDPHPFQVMIKDPETGTLTSDVEVFETLDRLVDIWGVD